MSLNIKGKPAVTSGGQGMGTRGSVRRIYFSTNGKPVATLEGQILRKRVRASVHMLRRPPGWAIDRSILEAARRDGAVAIEVFDIETRKVFTAPINAFEKHGVHFNRGFGDQVALPLQYWRVEVFGLRQLALWEG